MVRREAFTGLGRLAGKHILLKTNQTQKHFSLDNIIQLIIIHSIYKPIEILSLNKMPRILSRILVVWLVRTNHIIP
jgi:hypothetical protein